VTADFHPLFLVEEGLLVPRDIKASVDEVPPEGILILRFFLVVEQVDSQFL